MTIKNHGKAVDAAKAAGAAQTHDFVPGKGFVAIAPGAIAAAAKVVANAPKVRQTAKKAKPEPKRPLTDGDVVAEAMQFFNDLVAVGSCSKVEYVRALAKWPEGSKKPALQRRDVMEIVAAYPELAIASATISTQFQFARSGKPKQNM